MPEDIRKAEGTAFVPDDNLWNKLPKIEPLPEPQIGIDTNNNIYRELIDASINNQLDTNALNSFLTTSRTRDQVYQLIDTMSEDSLIAAVLNTWAEDSTEVNENGDIIWASSNDEDVKKFVDSILKAARINKYAFSWIHSLCKYGDLYLRMYRKSDVENDILEDDLNNLNKEKNSKILNESLGLSNPELAEMIAINDNLESKEQLNEDVKIKAYSKDDHYVNYLELMPNPAEMFELTKFGKSYAYIKANVPITQSINNQDSLFGANLDFLRYSFKKSDVTLYPATEFVHGCIQDNSNRSPEEVKLYLTNSDDKETASTTYKVRRGQSLLASAFRAWRELQLLENAIMLNRLTKSSLVRIISVEIGDMPKENVQPHLQGVKALLEQKQSFKVGGSLGEYTNPGPVENNVYIPTRNGLGEIKLEQVGGEYQAGQLTDLEFVRDKMFGSLNIPKQYFGFTGDSAGFDGGTSLSILSASYAKRILRIQNTFIQTITDAVNLICLDRGLTGYINKFTLKMVPPVTRNDLDRRENITAKVQQTSDIMSLLSDVDNPTLKLEILKNLMEGYLTDPEVTSLIQDEIDKLKAEQEKTPIEESTTEIIENEIDEEPIEGEDLDLGLDLSLKDEGISTEDEESGDVILPTPADLGLDFTDSNLEEFE